MALSASRVRSLAFAPASGLTLENVVLVGFQLPDPKATAPYEAMRPRGLLPAAGPAGGLVLRDVRILVSAATLQQHTAFFAPGTYNVSTVPNATFAYTVGAGWAPGCLMAWPVV